MKSPLDVYYKIINGTAVDGTDFNTPATGEVTIATNANYAFLLVYLYQYDQPVTDLHHAPPSQVWSIEVHCKANMGPPWIFVTGSNVTGDGTSTVSGCTELNSGSFVTDS